MNDVTCTTNRLEPVDQKEHLKTSQPVYFPGLSLGASAVLLGPGAALFAAALDLALSLLSAISCCL